jgi:hypothetical protein
LKRGRDAALTPSSGPSASSHQRSSSTPRSSGTSTRACTRSLSTLSTGQTWTCARACLATSSCREVARSAQVSPRFPLQDGLQLTRAGFGDRLLSEVKKLALKDVKLKIYAPPERKVSSICQSGSCGSGRAADGTVLDLDWGQYPRGSEHVQEGELADRPLSTS